MIGEAEPGEAVTERARRCKNFSSFSNDTRLMYNRSDLLILTSTGRNDRNADLCHLVLNPGLGEILYDHKASLLILPQGQATRLNQILDFLALDSPQEVFDELKSRLSNFAAAFDVKPRERAGEFAKKHGYIILSKFEQEKLEAQQQEAAAIARMQQMQIELERLRTSMGGTAARIPCSSAPPQQRTCAPSPPQGLIHPSFQTFNMDTPNGIGFTNNKRAHPDNRTVPSSAFVDSDIVDEEILKLRNQLETETSAIETLDSDMAQIFEDGWKQMNVKSSHLLSELEQTNLKSRESELLIARANEKQKLLQQLSSLQEKKALLESSISAPSPDAVRKDLMSDTTRKWFEKCQAQSLQQQEIQSLIEAKMKQSEQRKLPNGPLRAPPIYAAAHAQPTEPAEPGKPDEFQDSRSCIAVDDDSQSATLESHQPRCVVGGLSLGEDHA